MSRVYHGAYRVMVIMEDTPTADMWGMTEPSNYEDCQRACLYFALGVPFEGRRVKRALIVPVIGRNAPEPGTDWEIGHA